MLLYAHKTWSMKNVSYGLGSIAAVYGLGQIMTYI